MRIDGTVESKSRKGNSIKVNGGWYSTFNASDLDHVNWKDQVSFDFVTKGKYNNISGKVEVTAKAPAASSSGGGGKGGDYTLGVELGHASKLAMDVMLADPSIKAGSEEFYKGFVRHTEIIHGLMKGIKDKHSGVDVRVPDKVPKTKVEELIEEVEDISDADIF